MLRAPAGKPRRSVRALPLALALAVLPAVAATEAGADMRATSTCLDGGGIEAAAGPGYGGVWFSPLVDGDQRLNVALVTGTDEEPVRAALRACGIEAQVDLRPASYPYSAVVAARAEFGRRAHGEPGTSMIDSGLVSYGSSVRDGRFVISVTLHLDATDAQVATLHQIAASVTAESGVPIVFEAQRTDYPVPAIAETAPLPVPGPQTEPRPAIPPRITATAGSRREALRTGSVRLRVRGLAGTTTIVLRSVSGRRVVVGRGIASGKGAAVTRIRLTTAGRTWIRDGKRRSLSVTLRTAGGTTSVARLRLR
jgi:hypothetical protein